MYILTPPLALYFERINNYYFPMITDLNFSSFGSVAVFVKISATFSSVGTSFNFIVPACISDRIKWYLMSICFDL